MTNHRSLDTKRGPKPREVDGSAAGMMAEAREEVSATIASLVEIRDNSLASHSARVAANRAILESAGVIGRERQAAERLLGKPLDEMTPLDLETAAKLGKQATFNLLLSMSIVELQEHLAFGQRTLAEKLERAGLPVSPLD